MGTFFGKNDPYKREGKGFEARVAHPRPNQIQVPSPPPGFRIQTNCRKYCYFDNLW